MGAKARRPGVPAAAQGLCNGLSRIPFGHLSDKVSRRQDLVVAGIIGFSISLAGFGFSSSLIHFIGFGILSGVSMGLAFTSVGALIAEVVPPESRGVAMGGYNTCIYFGMMASSAGMGGIIQAIGFTNAFYLTALVNTGAIGVFILLFRRQ